MPISTTPKSLENVQRRPPVCVDAVAQPHPPATRGPLAWLGNYFALSLIHLVNVLWWVFVIALLVWSYAHSLFTPPRAAEED